jgi:hypothetical protein
MQPYITSHFEKKHMADVGGYEDFFTPTASGTKTEEEVFGGEFVDSFRGEYGISPAGLAKLGVVLTEDAIRQRTTLIQRTRGSFEEMLISAGFSRDEIQGFLRSFVLAPRERWNNAAKPFRGKDWWPWRYRRRLSLMTRPILALDDQLVIYAPAFCEDSFRHVVMESFQGAFETEYFDTRRMKEYVGRENARRGLAFNKSVAEIFRGVGWDVRTEVPMSELGAPTTAAAGDIDVLAWKGDSICVCECKELLFARTITEVSEQLSRFRGNKGDDLYKHLRRFAWVQDNPKSIQRIVRTATPNLKSLLITSKIVPMQFVNALDVEVVPVEQLSGII